MEFWKSDVAPYWILLHAIMNVLKLSNLKPMEDAFNRGLSELVRVAHVICITISYFFCFTLIEWKNEIHRATYPIFTFLLRRGCSKQKRHWSKCKPYFHHKNGFCLSWVSFRYAREKRISIDSVMTLRNAKLPLIITTKQ